MHNKLKMVLPKKTEPSALNHQQIIAQKPNLAPDLIKDFKEKFPNIKIQAVLADAIYGSKSFYNDVTSGINQIISHLKKDPCLIYQGKKYEVQALFQKVFKPIEASITIRGGKTQKIMYRAIRVHVNAHGCKRFVIAMKYEDQSAYRYLVASDLSWRGQDIVNAFTLRWLVEVFIQDTKANGGWFNMAKQQGINGSKKPLTLSLLLDHAMLCHPEQQALLKNNLPAYTVGNLRALVSMQSTIDFTREIISKPNAEKHLDEAFKNLQSVFKLRVSTQVEISGDWSQRNH